MKEIVVISGKGGTGKTSLTASFIQLAKNKVIAADCDVDAADLHILLHPDFGNKKDFYSGFKAKINQDTCIKCGICAEKCRFNAIDAVDKNYFVNDISCEGCGYCAVVCPTSSISMNEDKVGETFVSEIADGCEMVHASLHIGGGNSGKLVAHVKKVAGEIADIYNKELVIVDGPPGIGCPVISSLTGANLVVLVTEPSVSGVHDLKRVYALVKNFKIPSACIINKYDLNFQKTKEVEDFLKEEGIAHISNIAYREAFSKALTQGKTILEYGDEQLIDQLKLSWLKIESLLENM